MDTYVIMLCFPPTTLGAFNDCEALERLPRSSAYVQDYVHGVPSLPKQGLGAQTGPEVRNRFA